jgi:hypothetical protein
MNIRAARALGSTVAQFAAVIESATLRGNVDSRHLDVDIEVVCRLSYYTANEDC